jgi:hypothetical protein
MPKTNATPARASVASATAFSDADLATLAAEVLPAALRVSGLSVQEVLTEESVRYVVMFSGYSWLTYRVAAPDEIVDDAPAYRAELRNRILG